MRQFVTIATNAFMELVRQPIFLLLMTTSAVFEIFLATPYYFASRKTQPVVAMEPKRFT